ncbi:hypothetical protein C798_00060 [Herbaspirillum rubrisubalbicans Os34]|uniref:Uncharacterized protein n=1 Tax=Herbaspirillum rubrisubalbicans Os34 TaxID=1235827 RepID=A0A6M3ZIY0_9BURK|nr:hypothetical protein C798_00060 [Herbaspirillum rubrisubalbicans Os34]
MNFMFKGERLTTFAVSGIAQLIGYMPVLLMTQVLAQFGFQSSFHRQFAEMLQQAFFAYQILWILVIG